MMDTSRAVLDAMSENVELLPPDACAKLLDTLCASGVESSPWWRDVLVGDGDPLNREPEPHGWPESALQGRSPSTSR